MGVGESWLRNLASQGKALNLKTNTARKINNYYILLILGYFQLQSREISYSNSFCK
jgi:hypothetical protein